MDPRLREDDGPVLVPGAADSILLSISHAVGGSGGDWALDVGAPVARQPVDWPMLVDTAVRRDLSVPALAGLGYLAEQLGVAVPPETLAALRRPRAGRLAQRNFVVMTRRPGARHPMSSPPKTGSTGRW